MNLLIKQEIFVPIVETECIKIDPKLEQDRRFVRPWVNDFLETFGADYCTEFGKSLYVSSAIRPAQVQKRLQRRNRNAADYKGDFASTHLTGATIDISKRHMSKQEKNYLRSKLLNLQGLGQIIFIDEHRQPCYHVFVIW